MYMASSKNALYPLLRIERLPVAFFPFICAHEMRYPLARCASEQPHDLDRFREVHSHCTRNHNGMCLR